MELCLVITSSEGGKFHYIGGSVWHEPAEKVLVYVVV